MLNHELASVEVEAALDALDVGIIVLDREARIVVWNDWLARASRLPAASVTGRTIFDVLPDIRQSRLGSAIEQSFEAGSSSILTHSLNNLLSLHGQAGEELIHDIVVRPVYSDRTQHCLLQIIDVTVSVTRERVLRERQNARYRAIVDTAPDAIITTGLDRTIHWINETAGKAFGYAPAELLGRRVDILLDEESLKEVFSGSPGSDERGRTHRVSVRRKDGTLVPYEMSSSEHWRSEGRTFVTTIWRDVTERIAVETALREARDQLLLSNEQLEARVAERTREREVALAQLYESQKMETIGQLTGGVAHDFNNLLAIILGSLTLLKKGLPANLNVSHLVDGALQGAERGATLTRRLLAFARRQDLKLEVVKVQALIPDMMDFLMQSVGPNISIELDIANDLPAVKIDPNQLELALMNLAVNARDAMPDGGTLAISCESQTSGAPDVPVNLPDGEYIRISVADTGEGMSEATRSRAMEPFFTTKGVGKGTGLGLSMIHGMMAQSGGAMDIRSKLGEGTVVSLWLPHAREEDHPRQTIEPPPPVAASNEKLRVLLVDDDALVSMHAAYMLMDLGHSVLEAHSPLHALELLQSDRRFDAVITDYAMPKMNGVEFAGKVRERFPALPVILATGYAELPANTTLELPRLNKPYSQNELAAALAGIRASA